MSNQPVEAGQANTEKAAVAELPRVPCEKCGVPMLFGHNIDTKKDGPIDTRSTVYLVLKRTVDGKPAVMTAKKLLERLLEIRLMWEGEEVLLRTEDIEGLFPSHFNTCPSANAFSKSGGWKSNGKGRR